jgi:hypothetical protein
MPKGPHPFWGSERWFHPTVDAVDVFLKKHLPATGKSIAGIFAHPS